MNADSEFYTFTMAKIYTDQGHFAKAEAIYRHLLKNDPHNQILTEALENVVSRRAVRVSKKGEDLAPLFKNWLELAQEYKRRQRLKTKKGT